jgi:GT2 family glycosyltransferase
MQVFLEPGTEWPPWLDEKLKTRAAPAFLPSALVVRKSIMKKVGDFDPSYRICCDFDWFVRARDAGIPFTVLPEVLGYKRIHGANMIYCREALQTARLCILRASIERKHNQ